MKPLPDGQERELRVVVDPRRLGRGLFRLVAAVSYLGLCAIVWQYGFELDDVFDLIEFFGLSYEQNFPTWVSSSMLLACGVVLALNAREVGRRGERFRAHWWVLAGAFTYISIDEFVQLHEHLNSFFDYGGVLHFGWVIPVGIALAIFGLSYLGFLAHLPARTRVLFVVAGCLFVGGAMGVELALGWWTDREGDQNFTYALIDWVEESMEVSGSTLFLYANLTHLLASSTEPPVALGRVEWRRPAVRLAGLGSVALLLCTVLWWTGQVEHHRYIDRHGNVTLRDRNLGPDLTAEIRGGQRFRYDGTEAHFEKQPEARVLGMFALWAGVLGATLRAFCRADS